MYKENKVRDPEPDFYTFYYFLLEMISVKIALLLLFVDLSISTS